MTIENKRNISEETEMNAVILEPLGIPEERLAELRKPLEEKGVVFTSYARTGDTEELKKEVADADILIIANMPLPGEVIAAAEKAKFLDIAFTGVDHVDIEACRENGIAVSNAAGYSTEAVAELTVGMALEMSRKMHNAELRCRAGMTKDGLRFTEIKGKTVGIVGLGKIGTRSAELFHAFGAKILAYSRTEHADAPSFVRQVSFWELLEQSDYVVLHCPLTKETRGLIGRNELMRMKPSAFLINTARGPVVQTDALIEALNEEIIAGAAADVFDTEPPFDPGLPILNVPNLFVTPHIGFATEEAMDLRAQIVFDSVNAWLEGGQNSVVVPRED